MMRGTLRVHEWAALVAAGAIFALLVALLIRAVGDDPFALQSGWLAGMFVAIAAGSVLTVAAMAAVAPAPAGVGSLVGALVSGALLFDGLAIGFAPGLYAREGGDLAGAAALLLWAVGWFLVAGWVLDWTSTRGAGEDRAGP